jgi:hypothetical protein
MLGRLLSRARVTSHCGGPCRVASFSQILAVRTEGVQKLNHGHSLTRRVKKTKRERRQPTLTHQPATRNSSRRKRLLLWFFGKAGIPRDPHSLVFKNVIMASPEHQPSSERKGEKNNTQPPNPDPAPPVPPEGSKSQSKTGGRGGDERENTQSRS